MDKKIKRALPQIKRVFSQEKALVAVYLYGSYVTDRAHEGSDVDIALLLKPQTKMPLEKLLELMEKMEEVTSLHPVDLRILNEMSLSMQGEILIRGALLYSKNEKNRVDFEIKTLKLYFDYLPYLKRMREEFLKRVALKGIL